MLGKVACFTIRQWHLKLFHGSIVWSGFQRSQVKGSQISKRQTHFYVKPIERDDALSKQPSKNCKNVFKLEAKSSKLNFLVTV